jgi:hypothetical protein
LISQEEDEDENDDDEKDDDDDDDEEEEDDDDDDDDDDEELGTAALLGPEIRDEKDAAVGKSIQMPLCKSRQECHQLTDSDLCHL